MKALVGAFNQEKALVGAFSVIVQPVVEPMEHYTALVLVYLDEVGKAGEDEAADADEEDQEPQLLVAVLERVGDCLQACQHGSHNLFVNATIKINVTLIQHQYKYKFPVFKLIIVGLTGLILILLFYQTIAGFSAYFVFTWRVASQLKDPGQFEDPEDLENVLHA